MKVEEIVERFKNNKERDHNEKDCITSHKGKGKEEKSLEEKLVKVFESHSMLQSMDEVEVEKIDNSTLWLSTLGSEPEHPILSKPTPYI